MPLSDAMSPRIASLNLNVPTFPRLDEYFGVWAIEPTRGAALWDAASRMDLGRHVSQDAREREDRKSEPRQGIQKISAAGGAKQIAVIQATGLLMKQRSSMTASTSTIELRRDIRNAANDPEIGAILLAFDSPGGTAAGTDDLAAEILAARQKKPVWAHVDDLTASAAYYAASQAEKIFANNASALVGSIGTILTIYDTSAAAEKEGVKTLVFSTGPLKGAGADGTPVTETQQAYFQRIVDGLQEAFDQAVKRGRKLSDKQLSAVRSGEVFVATEALRLGLIDGIQSMETTLAQLASAISGKQATSSSKGAFSMTFEAFLADRDLSADKLNDKQLAKLHGDYLALLARDPSQATAVSKPAGDGASLMGDLESFNKNALRIAKIQSICRQAGNPSVEHQGKVQSVEAHALEHGWSLLETEQACKLAKLRDHRPQILTGAGGGQFNQLLVMEAAVAQAGKLDGLEKFYSPQTLEQAHKEFKGRISLQEMLMIAAETNGYAGRLRTVNRSNLGGVLQAAFSTMELPGILSAIANKFLLAGFMNVDQSWRKIAKITPVKDFKTITSYRMLDDMEFKEVGPTGEIEHGEMSEESFSNRAKTYARMFAATRQDFINDDLGVLTTTPKRIGRGGGLALNKIFWTIFIDNSSFFVDPGANFFKGAATVLQSSSLKTGLQKFRDQKDNEGNPLGVSPRFLLVPTPLETTAAELMRSMKVNTGGSSSTDKVPSDNIWAGMFEPVVSPYLNNANFTGYSDTAWFLLASPDDIATIEVCFLDGVEVPTIEDSESEFNVLGAQFRGYLDFGVALQDVRGGVKSKGAA